MFFSKAKTKKSKQKPINSPIWDVKGVMFDADLLPHIKKAEEGNYESARMLAECFLYGNDEAIARIYKSGFRVKPNTDVARYYSNLALKMHEEGSVNFPMNYAIDLSIRAGIEAEAGSYEEAKSYYLKSTKQMVDNVPPEQWDFHIFLHFRFTMLHFGIITQEQYEF